MTLDRLRLFLIKYFSVSLLITSTFCTLGQVSVPGDYFNNIDKFDTTRINFYSSISEVEEGNQLSLIDPYTSFSFNSGYARSYNDGPIWRGKGATWELHAGFQGRIGKLSYTFYPVVFYSQNRDNELAPTTGNLNPFNFQLAPRGGIDLVQQYGSGSFVAFHPGQSEIRVDLGTFVGSVSTQNYSWGPSRFNPILMSRQAAGFPHLRLGLKPFEVRIGQLNTGRMEFNLIYGFLNESNYFDANTDNDIRYFNALSYSYAPSFLKGLKFGYNKVLYKQTGFFEAEDILSPFVILESITREGNFGNDSFDQLTSFTFEWILPSSNFRAYFEYALNDFSNVILEPDHTRGFTVGFERGIRIKEGQEVVLHYEHNNLSSTSTSLYRPTPSFFAHGVNRQGYTNDGQVIGAGIGPGANADNFSVTYQLEDRSYGVLFQRIEANKDYFVDRILDGSRRDQEYTLQLYYERRLPKYVLSFMGGYNYNYNRYFLDNQNNITFSFGARRLISD